jgi:hypothetical protein
MSDGESSEEEIKRPMKRLRKPVDSENEEWDEPSSSSVQPK